MGPQLQPLWRWRWPSRLVAFILLLCPTTTTCLAPHISATTGSRRRSSKVLSSCRRNKSGTVQSAIYAFSSPYGRGAEIWPECNEAPIQLTESFPGGKIPDSVRLMLQQSSRSSHVDVSLFQKVVTTATTMEKLAAAVAAAVLIGGFVPLVDVLLATGWSTYLWSLHRFSKAPRQADGEDELSVNVPNLPSLPPQGHVPLLVSNPLGYYLTNSKLYQQWLEAGVILGLWAPILLLSRYTVWAQHKQLDAAMACARPLFWLCCQALTEAVARNVLMPLPIRILVPISYNAIRIGPLWAWATSPIALNVVGRLLAISNWAYTMTNLLVFLLPVASLRYLRAHFFAVEAKEVHMRELLDEGIL